MIRARYRISRRKVVFFCVWVGMVSGCSEPTSIEVHPKNPRITSKDQSLKLRVDIKDQSGRLMTNVTPIFRSLTPTVAYVDQDGNIRVFQSGHATLKIEAGKTFKEVKVRVQIPTKLAIEPDSPRLLLGVTRRFRAELYDDRGERMIAPEVHWANSNPEVLSLNDQGDVKTLTEGTATITAHASGIQGSTEVTVKHEKLHEDGTLR